MYPGLSLQQAPPLWVPFRFLMTAPFFAAAAHGVILYSGPEVLSNRWSPHLLAAVHLYVVGFLGSTMLGVLFQMLPVLVGAVVDQPLRTARWVHGPLTFGVVALATGFGTYEPWFFHLAVGLLGWSVGFFLWQVSRALVRSQAARDTVRSINSALFSLAATLVLGVIMAILTAQYSADFRGHLTDIHAAFGLMGWVFLLIAGVSLKVVPMFFVTDAYPQWQVRFLPGGMLGLLASLAATHGLGWPGSQVILLLILILFLSFVGTTLRLLLKRRRPQRDTSLNYWLLGLGGGFVSGALFGLSQLELKGSADFVVLMGWFYVVVFVSSIMTGMYFKIVPFLAWLHLRPLAVVNPGGPAPVRIPYMNHFLDEKSCRLQFRLFAAGLGLFVIYLIFQGLGLDSRLSNGSFYLAESISLASSLLLGTLVVRAYLRNKKFINAHAASSRA